MTAPPKTRDAFTVKPLVRGGRVERGSRIILHGVGGSGKTTLIELLVRGRPDLNVAYLSTEGGETVDLVKRSAFYDVEQYEQVVTFLTEPPADADVLVIDTMTGLEALARDSVLREMNIEHMDVEKKAWAASASLCQKMTHVRALLEGAVRVGKAVILICHTTVARVVNPESNDYIAHAIALFHDDKKGSVRDPLFQWADAVGFVTSEGVEVKRGRVVLKGGEGARGMERVVRMEALAHTMCKRRGDTQSLYVVPDKDSESPYPVMWDDLIPKKLTKPAQEIINV